MLPTRRISSQPVRPDRDGLKRLIAAVPTAGGLLGLTHVTTGYLMRDIIEAGSIAAPQNCDVLKEPVIYAFYGRAAFRKGGSSGPTDMPSRMPVVFILDPQTVPKPKYVFPFDSGAFVSGLLDDHLDPYMPLFDFHLEPDVRTAAKIADYFFGGCEPYLTNQPKDAPEIPVSEFEAHSVLRIISAGKLGANELDDRISTVELIFDKPLDVRSTIRAAIMPADLAADANMGKRLEADGIRVDAYPWIGGTRPGEYHMQIRQLVSGIYKDFGWIDHK